MTNNMKTKLPESVFELVDNSDDVYYCLGLYYTLEEALDKATEGDSPCFDCDEYGHLEIRERDIGYTGWGEHGVVRAEIEWKQTEDDSDDSITGWKWDNPVVTLNENNTK